MHRLDFIDWMVVDVKPCDVQFLAPSPCALIPSSPAASCPLHSMHDLGCLRVHGLCFLYMPYLECEAIGRKHKIVLAHIKINAREGE